MDINAFEKDMNDLLDLLTRHYEADWKEIINKYHFHFTVDEIETDEEVPYGVINPYNGIDWEPSDPDDSEYWTSYDIDYELAADAYDDDPQYYVIQKLRLIITSRPDDDNYLPDEPDWSCRDEDEFELDLEF
ncbi:MAG: hypothetical protein LBS85_05325 [Clostridiales Family XIII bacterium]|jgi:hypothetical protein|nr:hypothetical protein [Clostridiales Family XIII bacterium]